MATKISNESQSAQSYLSLNIEWAPYLSEKHVQTLELCTNRIDQVGQNFEKIDITQLSKDLKQLDIFKKRIDARQATISFIKEFLHECANTQVQLNEHRRVLKQKAKEEDSNNNPSSALKTCFECTDKYEAFLKGLTQLAEQTLAAFKNKKFDKGLRADYPNMLEHLGRLLMKADMFKEVQSMPENQIKKDLISFFEKDNARIQIPNKDQFNSFNWILVLKGFSDRGARKLLITDEMVKADAVSKLEKAASNTSEFLLKLIATCEKQANQYAEQKTSCELIVSFFQDPEKPELLKKQEQALIEHVTTCADYFSGLKKIMLKTQETFQKEGVEGVKIAYPSMVQNTAALLKKANLLKLVEEMPDCLLKKNLQAELNSGNADANGFTIDEWMHGLYALQVVGEHFLNQNIPSEDQEVVTLADKVDQAVKISSIEEEKK